MGQPLVPVASSGDVPDEFPLPGSDVEVEFRDAGVMAWGGCNELWFPVSDWDEGRIDVVEAVSTDQGCAGDRDVQERWLSRFFLSSPRFEVSDAGVKLISEDAAIRLTAKRTDAG